MSRPSYDLVLSAVEGAPRTSADVAAAVACSEWAAARTLQQLRERGFVELVNDPSQGFVWQMADSAVA